MHTAKPVKAQLASNLRQDDPQGIFFKEKTGDPSLDEHLGWIRKVNWASTPLGPLKSWPLDLIQLCHVCLLDPEPRLLLLRSERVLFYNEAYAELIGDKHPSVLGQNAIDAWGEVALDSIKIPLATAEATGRRIHIQTQPLTYKRDNFLEEVFVAWAVMSLQGSVSGFYVSFTDVTETTLAERRRAVLRDLHTACSFAAWDLAQDPYNFWQSIAKSLTLDSLFPFAFLYVMSPNAGSESSIDTSSEPSHQTRFQLEGAVGDQIITSTLPEELGPDHFVLSSSSRNPTLIRQNEASKHVWFLSAHDCILVPLRSNRSEKTIAYLFLGTNPKRPYNETYREWVHELTRCLGNAITDFLLTEEDKRKQHYQAMRVAREQQSLTTALATRDREALAVTEQYQRTLKLVGMAGVGIFEYDTDGRLIYANEAFKAIVSFMSNAMYAEQLSFLDVTYPEDTEYLMSKWNSVASGTAQTFEMRYKTHDGQGVWVLAATVPVFDNGIVTSVSGCITNIHDTKMRGTESVQRLQALEKARSWEQRFANFAEMAPIAIYFGSQSHHRLSYCNPAWFEMTGHPVVPFEEIDWASIIYEEDLELVRNHWTSVFSTQNYTSIQFRLKRRWVNGKGATMGPIWVTSSALPEHKEDGSIKGIIGTMLDISALKFTEMEQQMKVQEATEAKRQSLNFIDMTSQ
jgi:PAS domain S-box-containing protein